MLRATLLDAARHFDASGQQAVDQYLETTHLEIWGLGGQSLQPSDLIINHDQATLTALGTEIDLRTVLCRYVGPYLCIADNAGSNIIFVGDPGYLADDDDSE